jgi:hypothetical protein
METWMLVGIGAVAVIAAVLISTLVMKSKSQHKGTERLQRKFGDEYGNAVADVGRKKGEADLEKREGRVEGFSLRALSNAEAERFTRLWSGTQARFIDDPGGAISDADRLLSEVMQARGYPVSDFEQRASDLSVDHAEFVANYRAAHAEAVKHSRGAASTENLRQAMVNYRWLFSDLVATDRVREPQAATV